MRMRYNPIHPKQNGNERDEYPAFSTREAWPPAESHAQKPRGRKEHSRAGASTQSPRRIRLIRVKDERGCRVMAAGSNLGGTAGYAYTRSRPEQNESVRGGFSFGKKANRTAKGLPMRAKGRLMTMQAMTGKTEGRHSTLGEVLAMETGAQATVHGLVHTLRDLGDVRFALLRMPQGVLQCVLGAGEDVRDGDAVTVSGEAVRDERAPGGVELHAQRVKVLSRAAEAMPVPIGKNRMNLSLDTDLSLRFVTLRNLRKRAVFKIQEGIVRGFREALQKEGFTEIHSPKIVAQNAEGGANLFRMEYFGRRAYLAQSPQFYKQAMVPVYERVFEIGPVFRAEKHNTQRHLNEYTSMDFEMGFIDGFEDVMQMETKVLQNIMAVLKADYAPQLAALHVALPDVTRIPAVRFDEAKRMVSEKYGRAIRDPFDLEPEEEQLISRLFAEEYGSEFVFVTHYPSKKRPFYAADDPEDPRYTLSFDLLFRGLEVTTGGQRIHDYDTQVAKMLKKGMNPEDFAGYLMIHKYGTCPHGGLGLGLERLTARLLGENNVRETCLFPRDQQRIEP